MVSLHGPSGQLVISEVFDTGHTRYIWTFATTRSIGSQYDIARNRGSCHVQRSSHGCPQRAQTYGCMQHTHVDVDDLKHLCVPRKPDSTSESTRHAQTDVSLDKATYARLGDLQLLRDHQCQHCTHDDVALSLHVRTMLEVSVTATQTSSAYCSKRSRMVSQAN